MALAKIGILGTGDVGQALGKGFVDRGHAVVMGTRDPHAAKVQAWVKAAGPGAAAGTFAEAAAFGDVVALCTAWSGTEAALRLAQPDRLRGKVVMDVTNPLHLPPQLPPQLALGTTDSGGEQVQRWLPGAKVVKVFNTVGYAHFVAPSFPEGRPDQFLCGDDPGAKQVVAGFCQAFGWGTVDAGGIVAARLTEPMCLLWVHYGMRTGTWGHAFKLLRK